MKNYRRIFAMVFLAAVAETVAVVALRDDRAAASPASEPHKLLEFFPSSIAMDSQRGYQLFVVRLTNP